MKRKSYFLLLFFCVIALLALYVVYTNYQDSKERYVVVLSMDGFRPDYLTKAHTPNIDSIIKVGVSSELIPCYPTITFPNHYSMATGLYPDNHGLVGNHFYESSTALIYTTRDRSTVKNPYFYGGEPVWLTAKRQGIRSGCFFWVGSDAEVDGEYANHWKAYDGIVPYYDRVDTIISWLKQPSPERPRLIMWYLDEPDHSGHSYSPDSPKTWAAVERSDSALGYFLSEMRKLPIAKKIDFVLVSDHGMATYTPEQAVNLYDYLPRDSFHFVAAGVPCQLYTTPTYRDSAYKILQEVPRVRVYKKEELPERLHYGKNERVGDLVVMPDLGTYIYFAENATPRVGGAHGYDNNEEQMRALFCAFGPSFNKGQRYEPFPNIAIYPLICRLLNITPAPNDADEGVIIPLLRR